MPQAEYTDQELHYAAAQGRLDKARKDAIERLDGSYYYISSGEIAQARSLIYLADVLREALLRPS